MFHEGLQRASCGREPDGPAAHVEFLGDTLDAWVLSWGHAWRDSTAVRGGGRLSGCGW